MYSIIKEAELRYTVRFHIPQRGICAESNRPFLTRKGAERWAKKQLKEWGEADDCQSCQTG